MKTITVRVPDSVYEVLEAVARELGFTSTGLVRHLIDSLVYAACSGRLRIRDVNAFVVEYLARAASLTRSCKDIEEVVCCD